MSQREQPKPVQKVTIFLEVYGPREWTDENTGEVKQVGPSYRISGVGGEKDTDDRQNFANINARDPEEARRVLDADERWVDAFNRSDVDGLVAIYAADVIVMPPDRPDLVGRPAVREWIAAFFRENAARQKLVTEEVAAYGDWAWLRGHFEIEATLRSTGETSRTTGKHLVIWCRQPDGSWLAARDIWNTRS